MLHGRSGDSVRGESDMLPCPRVKEMALWGFLQCLGNIHSILRKLRAHVGLPFSPGSQCTTA